MLGIIARSHTSSPRRIPHLHWGCLRSCLKLRDLLWMGNRLLSAAIVSLFSNQISQLRSLPLSLGFWCNLPFQVSLNHELNESADCTLLETKDCYFQLICDQNYSKSRYWARIKGCFKAVEAIFIHVQGWCPRCFFRGFYAHQTQETRST